MKITDSLLWLSFKRRVEQNRNQAGQQFFRTIMHIFIEVLVNEILEHRFSHRPVGGSIGIRSN